MPWEKAVAVGSTSDTAGNSARTPDLADGHGATWEPVAQYPWRDAWVVVADGEYDMHSIPPLAHALTTAAATHAKVVLDTSRVTFADSSLVNLLVLVHQRTALRVAAPGPRLRRLLDITGVDTILHVRSTVEEAATA
ncbi:STAS domain-containing protein [Streptomyces sp. NPDC001780]